MILSKSKIFLIVLIITVLSVAGFFLWKNNKTAPKTADFSISPGVNVPAEFQLGDETIPLTWTDGNDGENLIIQSDQKYYDGNDSAVVYFSITNASGKDQKTKIYFWFDGEEKELAEIAKIAPDGSHQSNQSNPSNQISRPAGAKDIKGYTAGSYTEDTIASGATNFYQAVIKYPADSSGEFFIEAFGNKAYGLLDPYFTSGLVGYWPFDGDDVNWSTTTAYDRSVQGNNGTLTNMSQSTSPKPGKVGQALNFDGTSSYVDVSNESNFDFEKTDPFSICAWIKKDNLTKNYQAIVSKMNNTWRGYAFFTSGSTEINNPSAIGFILSNANATNDIVVYSSDNSLTNSDWNYVCVTYSGNSNVSGVSFYINGISQAKETVRNGLSATILNSVNAEIGHEGVVAYPEYFDGPIDEVRIYSRALSPTEITDQYRAGARKFQIQTGQ